MCQVSFGFTVEPHQQELKPFFIVIRHSLAKIKKPRQLSKPSPLCSELAAPVDFNWQRRKGKKYMEI
jgi:hypothetical protein